MSVKLQTHRLEDLSDIQYSLGSCTFKSGNGRILIIKFTGEYGHGSGGNRDAAYMGAVVRASKHAFDPSGIILDLQDLIYEWGDEIIDPIAESQVLSTQSGLVVSDKNRESLSGLINYIWRESNGWLFDSLEEAIVGVENNYRMAQEILNTYTYPFTQEVTVHAPGSNEGADWWAR